MSTKLIGALIIALALFGGWGLYKYWETFEQQKAVEQKETAARNIDPNQLPGMPSELQASLAAAEKQGSSALKNWLKVYARVLQDPRKAWIELDYCGLVYRNDPQEARRVFASVKQRTPPTSPIWPRLEQMQNTYE